MIDPKNPRINFLVGETLKMCPRADPKAVRELVIESLNRRLKGAPSGHSG